MNIYYHIVPVDDGYTFLCLNRNNGELYLSQKTTGSNPDALIFSSKRAATEWIEQFEYIRLPQGHFKAERFGTLDKIEKFADLR